MSIQYGSLPITDIKYCDPQGTLKNVSSVVRNGTSVWDSRPRTDNHGKWIGPQTFVYDSEEGYFIDDGSSSSPEFIGLMFWKEDNLWLFLRDETHADAISGDEYTTQLDHGYFGVLNWSPS